MDDAASFFRRLSAAMSDTITAGIFLAAWIAPLSLGVKEVRGLPPAIIVEFLVMHASILYGLGMRGRDRFRVGRWSILGVITAIYLVPIVCMALTLETIAPVVAFVWLYTGRFALVWLHPVSAEAETKRMRALWLVSLASFCIGTVLVNKLPLPAMGFHGDALVAISMSHHPGPDAQVEGVKTMAFGVLYFLAQACAKFWLAGRDPQPSGPTRIDGIA